MPPLISLTPLASPATGAFWDDKLIQLDTLADLFKRNYFAPGALRMPDSPLVRKYLELSNDLALFDSIAPPQATDGRVDALAEALRSGAVRDEHRTGYGWLDLNAPPSRLGEWLRGTESRPGATGEDDPTVAAVLRMAGEALAESAS